MAQEEENSRLIEVANTLLQNATGQGLNNLEKVVLKGAFEHKTYQSLADNIYRSQERLKDIGSQLWKRLSIALEQPIKKGNVKAQLERYQASLGSENSQTDAELMHPRGSSSQQYDWAEAPESSAFFGRQKELSTLKQWILLEGCRLVAIFGIGGIGKTALASRIARKLQPEFQYVIWRSLRNAPKLNSLLVSIIQSLSNQQEIEQRLPLSEADRIVHLIGYLRRHRCLLVLDNAETILQSGQHCGHYRPGYESYGDLLQQLGEQSHQSCLLLTSREKPGVFSRLEGETLPVRSLSLAGLKQAAGRTIVEQKGIFSATPEDWMALVDIYIGNPLALKIAGAAIQDMFSGEVGRFLNNAVYAFDDIVDLLDEHFNRLSQLEQQVMYWLAIEREPVAIEVLQADILQPVPKRDLFEAVKSLVRRSLIERNEDCFTQQPVVMEYLVERMCRQIQHEVITETPNLLLSHTLMKGQAKDYIKDSQRRVLIDPILQQLVNKLGSLPSIEQKLQKLLTVMRSQITEQVGYGAGNVLSLAQGLGRELGCYDFSELPVRQTDLQMTALQGMNLRGAELENTVFSNSLAYNLSVTFHPSQTLLAVGGSEGTIVLWTFPEMTAYQTLVGHTHWVAGLVFSPDGQLLASAGGDALVKVWDVATGECVATFESLQRGAYFDLAFSADGQSLVTVGQSGELNFWKVGTWHCHLTLETNGRFVSGLVFSPTGQTLTIGYVDGGIEIYDLVTGLRMDSQVQDRHMSFIWTIEFHPAGNRLFTCSHDHTIRIWDAKTATCLGVLSAHRAEVSGLVCSPNGQLLVSTSHDQTVRVWDAMTGECLQVLQGHRANVWDAAFSPDGEILATVSFDHTIRLWEVRTGRSLKTVQGSYKAIWDVVFDTDGTTLITSGEDRKLCFWNLDQARETGKATEVREPHDNEITTLAFHPKSSLLASGGGDRQLKLWSGKNNGTARTLTGYDEWIWNINFSPDGRLIAAAGHSLTVCIWNVATGECCHRIQSDQAEVLVWATDFSYDSRLLATASYDHIIRLWDTQTWQQMTILTGHQGGINSVAFSPKTLHLASGAYDNCVKIWDANEHTCLHTLSGHQAVVWSVSYSPDGDRVASASFDGMVKVWDASTGECLQTLVNPAGFATAACFHPIENRLASSYRDGTIRLWNLETEECELVLSPPKLYEGLNITGTTGLTSGQRASLIALGAVENS